MVVEDIKVPCEDCVHESKCTLRHPELATELQPEEVIHYCEKLDKHSKYVDTTRAIGAGL